MADIEKRLIALETRPVETSISNVSFTEENPTTLTTFIERVQVLESEGKQLEPSNSTLHSSTCGASSRCFEGRGAKALSRNVEEAKDERYSGRNKNFLIFCSFIQLDWAFKSIFSV